MSHPIERREFQKCECGYLQTVVMLDTLIIDSSSLRACMPLALVVSCRCPNCGVTWKGSHEIIIHRSDCPGRPGREKEGLCDDPRLH